MIEIPESLVLARQLNLVLKQRTVSSVVAWQSPHKLAFVYKNPALYGKLILGKTFKNASGFGSWVELLLDGCILAFSEGTSLFFTRDSEELPEKHQMLLQFDDGSFFCASIKMYGAIVGAKVGEYDNQYYLIARKKPSIFSPEFTTGYFLSLIRNEAVQKLSLKAFLATEQRIPGLGNGVLQDILFSSRLHPKKKVENTSPDQQRVLYQTLISTLKAMTDQGGRDTEKDLFRKDGGYKTRMSKNTAGQPCPVCKTRILKENYLGGSIYFCPQCQPLSSEKVRE